MQHQILFVLFNFLQAFSALVITPANRSTKLVSQPVSRELYRARDSFPNQKLSGSIAYANFAAPKKETLARTRREYLREKARKLLLAQKNGLKVPTVNKLLPTPRQTSLMASTVKAPKNSSRQLALVHLKKTLGRRLFSDLTNDLKRKRIDITKLDSKDIDYLNQFYHRNYLMQRKLPRMPAGPLPGPIESAHIDSNYKEVSGGSFALRLPNLPQVVMVNQSPYYQY